MCTLSMYVLIDRMFIFMSWSLFLCDILHKNAFSFLLFFFSFVFFLLLFFPYDNMMNVKDSFLCLYLLIYTCRVFIIISYASVLFVKVMNLNMFFIIIIYIKLVIFLEKFNWNASTYHIFFRYMISMYDFQIRWSWYC
jgi:hypothetical protein